MNPLFEIELKYDASNVTTETFKAKVASYLGKKYDAHSISLREMKEAKDTFYFANNVPVRFRRREGQKRAELTIKSRHNSESMASRDEIDLFVQNDKEAVDAFMAKLGAKELFTLSKDYCLFEVETEKIDLDIVHYTAYNELMTRHFIEVEVGKKSKISTEKALVLVGKLGKDISKMFGLGKPINNSLFEIFNNERLSK